MKSIIIFFNILVLQKQVQTLLVDHSNNSDMEDKIILLIISNWNTSFNKIQSNISSNNLKMSNHKENSLVESHGSDISGHLVVVILVK